MSFFGKKQEAPAYCQAGGAAPPLQVTVTWPGLCAPPVCDSGMAAAAGPGLLLPMPMPMPGPRGGCCDDPCQAAPCGAGGCVVAAQGTLGQVPSYLQDDRDHTMQCAAASADTQRQTPTKSNDGGRSGPRVGTSRGRARHASATAGLPDVDPVRKTDIKVTEAGPSAGPAAVNPDQVSSGPVEPMRKQALVPNSKPSSAMNLGKRSLDATEAGPSAGPAAVNPDKASTGPVEPDTPVSPKDLDELSKYIYETCVDDCGFFDPLVLDCNDVTGTALASALWELKLPQYSEKETPAQDAAQIFEASKDSAKADMVFFDMRNADDSQWNTLPSTRTLQKRGVRWVLLCVSNGDNEDEKKQNNAHLHRHFHRGYTAKRFPLFNMLMITLNWPEAWQKVPGAKGSLPEVNDIKEGNPFDTYTEQLKFLKRIFSVSGNTREALYPLDMREFLQHSEWRVKYSDDLGFRLRNGQAKLLERSLFTVLFSAFRYIEMRRQQGGDIDEAKELEHVLKNMVLVYVGGGAPNPDSESQHFSTLMQLVPYFKIVSYDVNRPQYKETEDTKQRVHVVQKMLDKAEIELLKNTMEAEMQKPLEERTYFCLCEDPRSDVTRRVTELDAAQKLEKNLLYLMKHAVDDSDNTKFTQYMKSYEEIRAGKLKLRQTLEETIKTDNFFQYELGNTLVKYTLAICCKITAPSMHDLKFWAPTCALLKQDFYEGLEHTCLMTKDLSGSRIPDTTSTAKSRKPHVTWWNMFIKPELARNSAAETKPSASEALETFKTNEIIFKLLTEEEHTQSFLQPYESAPIDEAYAYCTLNKGFEGQGIASGMRHLLRAMFNKYATLMKKINSDFDINAYAVYESNAIKKAHEKKYSKVYKLIVSDLEDLEAQAVNTGQDADIKKMQSFVRKNVYSLKATKSADVIAAELGAYTSLQQYYTKFKKQSEKAVFVFEEATRRTLLHLSLFDTDTIRTAIDDFLKKDNEADALQKGQMLGTLLLALVQTFHKVSHEENLPRVRTCLMEYVNSIDYWPGSCSTLTHEQFMQRMQQVYSVGSSDEILWERVARDVYCNMVLLFVTNEHLCAKFCKTTDNLFQMFKWYFVPSENERTALSWRILAQEGPQSESRTPKTRKLLTNYPGNKTWLELAVQYKNAHTLLPLIAGHVVDGSAGRVLNRATAQDWYDVLGSTFSKRDSKFLKPLHVAVYYGNFEAVQFILSTVEYMQSHNISETNRKSQEVQWLKPGQVKERLMDSRKIQGYKNMQCEETPLLIACKRYYNASSNEKGIYLKITQALLVKGANPTKQLIITYQNGQTSQTTPSAFVQGNRDVQMKAVFSRHNIDR